MDKVYFYRGAGNATFTSAASVAVGTSAPLRQVRVGDFNADGKADLAVSDGLNLYALWNNGNFSFSKVQLVTTKYGVAVTPRSMSTRTILPICLSSTTPARLARTSLLAPARIGKCY